MMVCCTSRRVESDPNFIYAYDAEGALNPALRFLLPTGDTDAIFVFENHLYRLSGSRLIRLDLSTGALPHATTEIYPQSVSAGDRIDLQNRCRYAENVVFDVGFDKPEWITLTDNRYLDIATDAPRRATALIRLRAINPSGITGENEFFFYVQVKRQRLPGVEKF